MQSRSRDPQRSATRERQRGPGARVLSVFEAYDRAGNKRSMVGQGFQVGAIRIANPSGTVFLFPASALGESGVRSAAPAPLVLEAASWINQGSRASDPVRIAGLARTPEAGQALADQVRQMLAPHLLGGAQRIQSSPVVEADAPVGGTVRIEIGSARPQVNVPPLR